MAPAGAVLASERAHLGIAAMVPLQVFLDDPQKFALAAFGQGREGNARSESHVVAVEVNDSDCVRQLVGHKLEGLSVASQEEGHRAVRAEVEALPRQDGDEDVRI